MRETGEDLQWLQAVLDASITRASSYLRASFQMPEHSLSAEQLVSYAQGVITVALATVTSRGEPRVAPIGALLYRGRFALPTTMEALRVRHILKQPAVSLTHVAENGLALIVHGHASILTPTQPAFVPLERLQRELQHTSPRDWGEGAYVLVEPDLIYTYARNPRQLTGQTSSRTQASQADQDQAAVE